MASSQTITTLFILSLLTISYAATDPSKLPKHTFIHFPIRKNQTSLQYYTTFEAGNSQSRTKVDALIDLGAQSVWFDCTSYVSSSYNRATCGSNKCKKASKSVCLECTSSSKPDCLNNSCGVYAYNPFQEYLTGQELGDDTIKVTSIDGQSVRLDYDVPEFQFSCADSSIVEGLPGDKTKGLVGLASSHESLASQISSAFRLPKKFGLCIPSDNGLGEMFIGGWPYFTSPSTADLYLPLVNTPLVINPVSTAPIYNEGDASDEYFINVKDIEINGGRIELNSTLLSIDKNGVGGTKISTIVSYTTLHSVIYKSLVNNFVKAAAAAAKKIERVASVAPFEACFDSKNAPKTITGPAVPDIDLVLEGKDIRFRLHGSNSMVEVKKDVICLAFVDGGDDPVTSIVLATNQSYEALKHLQVISSSGENSPTRRPVGGKARTLLGSNWRSQISHSFIEPPISSPKCCK